MKRLKIPIANITISERMRENLGDIDGMAASLDRYGLIQPIVITQANELIAGCRRLTAAKQLGWTEIDVTYRETLSEDELRELELEENIRRKDMDWKERVKGIAYVHKLKVRQAALDSESWGYRQTGELLNQPVSQVHYAVMVADLIASGDKQIAECENLFGALQLITRRREDEATALLHKRTALPASAKMTASVLEKLISMPTPAPQVPGAPPEKEKVYLSNMLYQGSCLDLWKDPDRWPPEGHNCSYIVTDPPYGIDVSSLSGGPASMVNIDTVEDEHQVEANWDLLSKFVPLAFHHLRAPGWLLLWCDPEHWYKLVELCDAVGFRTQKWPLVWCKTHACGNNQASKNWTKSVEFCLAASKGSAQLATPQATCHFGCSNDEFGRDSGHPFSKPIALWQWLYKAIIPDGYTAAVLDPFAGRGSSAVAAIDLGITPICMEMQETHYTHLYNNVKNRYMQKFKGNVEFL